MSYFRKSILPASDKKNVAGSPLAPGVMLAEDYNEHNDELIAIETFLGTGIPTDDQAEATAALSPLAENVLGMSDYLANGYNRLVGRTVCCSSGAIHSGRRITFPYNAQVAFLMQPLGTDSKIVTVSSTDGFPTIGVISILNDVPTANAQNTVEWISYNGKTDTQFLNCQRGAFGTSIGNHGGPIATPNRLNLEACQLLRTFTTACDFMYPAWSARGLYSFVEFGLEDDLVQIKRSIRLNPGSYVLTPAVLGAQYDAILGAADAVGILSATSSGDPILKSADPAYVALDELSWPEASAFAQILVTAGVIKLLRTGSDWDVGNSPSIPVFVGRMGVAYSIAAVTLSPLSVSNRTFLQAPTISQSANGTVNITMGTTSAGKTEIIQGVVQYKTFFVGNVEGQSS